MTPDEVVQLWGLLMVLFAIGYGCGHAEAHLTRPRGYQPTKNVNDCARPPREDDRRPIL